MCANGLQGFTARLLRQFLGSTPEWASPLPNAAVRLTHVCASMPCPEKAETLRNLKKVVKSAPCHACMKWTQVTT
jgi:hypothetical protein